MSRCEFLLWYSLWIENATVVSASLFGYNYSLVGRNERKQVWAFLSWLALCPFYWQNGNDWARVMQESRALLVSLLLPVNVFYYPCRATQTLSASWIQWRILWRLLCLRQFDWAHVCMISRGWMRLFISSGSVGALTGRSLEATHLAPWSSLSWQQQLRLGALILIQVAIEPRAPPLLARSH